MKLKFHFALFFSFYCCLHISAQAQYPRYKEVVAYFFDHYSAKNRTDNQVFKFEKTPRGWLIRISDYYGKQETIKEELLWSRSDAKFLSPDLIPSKQDENTLKEKAEFLASWDAPHYDACPYYNYRGWDWDIANDYKDLSHLSDTTLYGVGRAYSSIASGFLNDNSGLSNLAQAFPLNFGFNCLSAEQLAKYRQYANKAIEAFALLTQRNPEFETLVGSIETKLHHEYVTNYLNLLQYQNEEEALKELPDHLYSRFNFEAAKNYLISCDKNAILFTNGDGDTFPLLYLQAKENIRKDVTVINVSLLQTRRYQELLRKGTAFSPPLKFSFSAEDLKNPKYEFIIVKTDSIHRYAAKNIIAYAENKKNDLEYDTSRYAQIPGNIIDFKSGGNHLRFTLPFSNYMLGGQMLEFDLIVNNLHERPIYFSQGMADDSFLGMVYYIRLEGMVYRLQTKLNPPSSDGTAIITENVLNEHLMKTYAFDGLKTARQAEYPTLSNYTSQFNSLAKYYVNNQQAENALSTIDRYFQVFTNVILPYDYSSLQFANYYYKLGQTDKANAIGKQVLQNINTKAILHPSLFTVDDFESNRTRILEELKRMAIEHGQQSFYKDLW